MGGQAGGLVGGGPAGSGGKGMFGGGPMGRDGFGRVKCGGGSFGGFGRSDPELSLDGEEGGADIFLSIQSNLS